MSGRRRLPVAAIFSDVPQILFELLREYQPMLDALKARYPPRL
jgi:hypothetical protein